MKTIDLSEIIFNEFGGWIPTGICESDYIKILKAMDKVWNKAVDTCANQAYYEYALPGWVADKEQILKVKELIIK